MTDRNGSNGAGRLPSGRFALGNRLSPGNPKARRMHELRSRLLAAAAPEAVVKVIRRMGELAEAGDVAAARLYLEYTTGKPVQALEVSGPDGEALSLVNLQAIVLDALRDHPAARVAVAARLMELSHARPALPAGDHGGPGDPDVPAGL
jgi:hypothetical protein